MPRKKKELFVGFWYLPVAPSILRLGDWLLMIVDWELFLVAPNKCSFRDKSLKNAFFKTDKMKKQQNHSHHETTLTQIILMENNEKNRLNLFFENSYCRCNIQLKKFLNTKKYFFGHFKIWTDTLEKKFLQN